MRVCLQCGSATPGLFCPVDGMATVVRDRKPATTDLVIDTVFGGRYRICGLLGRGGMGAVYDARHTGTGQPVAIKTLMLDATVDPHAVQRFFLEAKRTAGLQHPNTVRVFDFGQSDDGVFFLVMERLQGQSLADRLRELAADGRTMSTAEVTRIGVAVLRSLGEAHRTGLVHRDLKPANIFLHDIGEAEPMVKVLDFGVAKQSGAQLTQTGMSVGTPSYMSPEQVTGAEVDGRSDLYALGVVLYQCLSGALPFAADSAYTVMMKHVHEPPPSLRADLAMPPAMAALVARALAKQPTERFDSAAVMREALESLLPVAVQAPSAAAIAVAPSARATPLASSHEPEASRLERVGAAPSAGVATAADGRAGRGRWWAWSMGAVALVGGGLWWLVQSRTDAPAPAPADVAPTASALSPATPVAANLRAAEPTAAVKANTAAPGTAALLPPAVDGGAALAAEVSAAAVPEASPPTPPPATVERRSPPPRRTASRVTQPSSKAKDAVPAPRETGIPLRQVRPAPAGTSGTANAARASDVRPAPSAPVRPTSNVRPPPPSSVRPAPPTPAPSGQVRPAPTQ
jgi:hypothetical protein